jgi:tol-pal system protein YbgF
MEPVMRSAALVCVCVLLAGCATTPEGPDPVQLKLTELDGRVGRIDRLLDNQSLLQLAQQVEALQAQLRVLNGRIEELQNENASLRKQQRDLYADLEQRLTELQQRQSDAGAVAPSGGAAGGAPVAVPGSEQAEYAAAFELLKSADFPAAIAAFQRLAAAYPRGALADNTQYWLGEAHYVTRDYDSAAACFQKVLADWPDSRKAPDALLKLGYTQLERKQTAAGRSSLQQVVARYPGSDAARLAAERLQKLGGNGR